MDSLTRPQTHDLILGFIGMEEKKKRNNGNILIDC
jgi:hypothetical protein